MKHTARKRFGQNFLTDTMVIDRIVSAINPKAQQSIVEIGPGLGAITERFLRYVQHLQVIEIDRDLVATLAKQHGDRLSIHSADVLKFDFSNLTNKPWRIVGNLPYNISTPLLFHLLNYAENIIDMHFMLQKEVVARICAAPRTKNYGRLSIMLQYHCQVDDLFTVANTAFDPQPKVESAIIRLKPYVKKPFVAKDETVFAKVVKTAFTHRRKTIANNLSGLLNTEDFAKLDIDPKARPETLSVREFVAMSDLSH